MTRELHAETDVQRAESTDQVPPEVLERGYEQRDAPAGQVALGAAALLGLMLLGLAVPALVLPSLRGQPPASAPPFADTRLVPPLPRLLEAEVPPLQPPLNPPATGRDASPGLEAAMRRVEAAGWGEDLAAPSQQAAARDHLGDAR